MTDVYTELLQENSELKAKILRLEQENKILKSNTNVLNDYITKNEQLKTNIDHLVKINESLKQENKDLKKQIEILLGQLVINDGEDITVQISQSQFDEYNELKEENEGLKIKHQRYRECSMQLNKKYKSALEKIRNDLKEVCKEECDYTKPKFCGDCDCRYGQILNKINEALGC